MKRFYGRVIAGAFAVATLTGAVAAQARSASQTATQLSELTAVISARLNSNTKAKFDDRFRRMAEQRREIMLQLAEADPAAALRNALPEQALAKMPSDIASLFEKRGTFSGELAVEAECEENNYRTLRTLKSGDSSKQLYLDADPTTELKTGDQITVQGYDLNGKILASAENTAVTTAAALTGTTGEKRVLVILVNFQDNPSQPYTAAHANDVVFNQASNFLRENSYGQTWLTGDVFGWYTMPINTTCDTNTIGTYARQAASAAGVNVSAYEHYVYAFPYTSCGFSGRSSVGGSPSHLWINSGLMGLPVFGHEFGHSLGLYHSQSLDCGNEVVAGGCTADEYGDTYDIMGISKSVHMNAFQKERLGWLNAGASPPIQTVSMSGTYFIDAYETVSPGVKSLKILKSIDPATGARTYYYLEHRTPTGFDSSLGAYGVQNGILVHTGAEGSGLDTFLLDMTPSTVSWYDATINIGQTFSDPESRVSFAVLTADNAGATVQVTIAAQDCVRASPTVTVTPGRSSWMGRGSTFGYTVSVTNNNSGGCTSETFHLSANLPNGLSASFPSSSLNLSNGANGTTVANITSSANAIDGSYNFGVSAVNGSNATYTSTGSGSYVLVSGLAVTAAPGASKYSRTQTATVAATVNAAGSPVASATVTFTMTKPSGAVVTQTVTTGADGKAAFSYRFDRKRDPIGMYTVGVAAVIKSYTGQAATSFSVTK